MIEDGLLQTIEPSLVSTKVNRAYRLHHDAMMKSYQAYKKAAWAVVLWPEPYARGMLATGSILLKLLDLKRGLERLTHKVWSIAAFILTAKIKICYKANTAFWWQRKFPAIQ